MSNGLLLASGILAVVASLLIIMAFFNRHDPDKAQSRKIWFRTAAIMLAVALFNLFLSI